MTGAATRELERGGGVGGGFWSPVDYFGVGGATTVEGRTGCGPMTGGWFVDCLVVGGATTVLGVGGGERAGSTKKKGKTLFWKTKKRKGKNSFEPFG